MGSLDEAAADNTTQEATLNTIRSVSGDWDNSNVSSSTFGGVSAFTSSGTFTAPNGCTAFKAMAVGGGGAGGGGSSGSQAGFGGAAGCVYAQVQGLSAGATVSITVGSGGTVTTSDYSNAGGASSFSIYDVSVTANGGSGGNRRERSGINGNGGTASGGYLNFAGRKHSGNHEAGTDHVACPSASTPFGNVRIVGQTGAGATYGVGGQQGSDGGDGLVLIEW